ncbi:MAG: hypothetical protein P9L92_17070 [Candidatus Electryonea clarkiae]|nr:hypothetical protein [Candidatus Electryonea clarkiae]MDP8288200.1 hypothetical protein [Candidatus Electryonea clarkiae]
MKVCPSCKIKYEDNKKFCKKCGTTLISQIGIDPKVVAQRQVFENRLQQTPENSDLLFEYGSFLAEYTFYDEALTKLYQASSSDPENLSISEKIADILIKTEKYTESIEVLIPLIEKSPNSTTLRDKLITAYLKSDNLSAAQKVSEELLNIAPDNQEYLTRYRDLLKMMPEFEEKLVQICKIIIKINPQEISTLRIYATTLLSIGNLDGARGVFKQILKLEPTDPKANLYIAIEEYEQANPEDPKTYNEAITRLQKGLKVKDK